MPSSTTRTLNPLPFDALEPKRFEDLIRQLAYDFRPWRMLEATGRSGSDDGYDARGYESVDGQAADPPEGDADQDDPPVDATADRLWLIQCKRERTISPSKMRKYLADISDEEASKLYGVIFAAACDFSKRTRDDVFAWARSKGIAEVHVWGRAEVEDQLFQPKNDHLLFAYFSISLQIRRRSLRTDLRAKLTMKRKAMRHLGSYWMDNKIVLLRDPTDEYYPYVYADKNPGHPGWQVVDFNGHHTDFIKLAWRRFYAYLDDDGKHWDCANSYNDRTYMDHVDPWISQKDRDRDADLRAKVGEFWETGIPVDRRAYLDVTCFIKYNDIIEIDEKGDDIAEFPHIFVSLKDGRPINGVLGGELTVPSRLEDEATRRFSLPRTLADPVFSDRIEVFPPEFRKAMGA